MTQQTQIGSIKYILLESHWIQFYTSQTSPQPAAPGCLKLLKATATTSYKWAGQRSGAASDPMQRGESASQPLLLLTRCCAWTVKLTVFRKFWNTNESHMWLLSLMQILSEVKKWSKLWLMDWKLHLKFQSLRPSIEQIPFLRRQITQRWG